VVDRAALTAELAARLDAVVPRPARVRVRDRQLWTEVPGVPGAWAVRTWAVWSRTGPPGSARSSHPDAHAVVRDGRIWLWYGPEDDPVLSLEPIPLERIARAP
jgi:hypothetical protein